MSEEGNGAQKEILSAPRVTTSCSIYFILDPVPVPKRRTLKSSAIIGVRTGSFETPSKRSPK